MYKQRIHTTVEDSTLRYHGVIATDGSGDRLGHITVCEGKVSGRVDVIFETDLLSDRAPNVDEVEQIAVQMRYLQKTFSRTGI